MEANALEKLNKYKLLAEGLVIGVITGLLVALFRLALSKADDLRDLLVEFARTSNLGAVVAAVILLVIALLISLILKWEPDCSGSGIPQVKNELEGNESQLWWRVIIAKFTGCALAIGGGLALGREGPSVQLGAMVGKGVARAGHRLLPEERLLITCGAGAGLSAAFGAPLAGAIFALEELRKSFNALILITTMGATAVSDFIAAAILGVRPVFDFSIVTRLPLHYYWSVVLLGILLGAFGALYNKTLGKMQDLFAKLNKTWIRMLVAFAIAYVMFFVYPKALGSGAYLVKEICYGTYGLGALAVLLLVKFVYSTGSFGSGSPGGIFLPLLVLGAITGGLYSRLLTAAFGIEEEYIVSFVVIAMAGYFAAVVRAPATGIILITEMTADFSSLLGLVVVSLVAFVTADVCGGRPVYDQLLERRLGRMRRHKEA